MSALTQLIQKPKLQRDTEEIIYSGSSISDDYSQPENSVLSDPIASVSNLVQTASDLESAILSEISSSLIPINSEYYTISDYINWINDISNSYNPLISGFETSIANDNNSLAMIISDLTPTISLLNDYKSSLMMLSGGISIQDSSLNTEISNQLPDSVKLALSDLSSESYASAVSSIATTYEDVTKSQTLVVDAAKSSVNSYYWNPNEDFFFSHVQSLINVTSSKIYEIANNLLNELIGIKRALEIPHLLETSNWLSLRGSLNNILDRWSMQTISRNHLPLKEKLYYLLIPPIESYLRRMDGVNNPDPTSKWIAKIISDAAVKLEKDKANVHVAIKSAAEEQAKNRTRSLNTTTNKTFLNRTIAALDSIISEVRKARDFGYFSESTVTKLYNSNIRTPVSEALKNIVK